MNKEERLKIYASLAAPFPEEAIERTDGKLTGRGYSTTGIRAQFVINRLNEVLGIGGFRLERVITVRHIATSKGRDAFEATCEIKVQLGQWQDGVFVPFAEAVADGGHTAMTEADARKGAASNGLKKAAAMFGVGRQAYEGTLDDDNPVTDQPIPSRPTKAAGSEVPATALENGRVTSAQLTKMHQLVDDLALDWGQFRADVREQRGINVEYASRRLASDLIADLIARTKSRKSNGSSAFVERSAP